MKELDEENELLSLNQRVFDDLTDGKEMQLFVTSGFKYGADFLAYEGDPDICHAKYLVKVCDSNKGSKLPV